MRGVKEESIRVLLEDEELFFKVKIKTSRYPENDPRIKWIKEFSDYVKEQNMLGSVAECGVYKGESAYYINKYFPDRTLYLFDTFEGFDDRDLYIERETGDIAFLKGQFNQDVHFKTGAITREILELKMPHFEKCIIKKGYFPETTKGVDDTFVFVNLDMDLYQPQLAALNFFYSRMVQGGVILLHDYFHSELPGVRRAVRDFERKMGRLACFPVGDGLSIAVIKT